MSSRVSECLLIWQIGQLGITTLYEDGGLSTADHSNRNQFFNPNSARQRWRFFYLEVDHRFGLSRQNSRLILTDKCYGMICCLPMTRQKKLFERFRMNRFMSMFAAKDNDSWVSAYLECPVVDACFGRDNNSIFFRRIVNDRFILFALNRGEFAHILNIQRR